MEELKLHPQDHIIKFILLPLVPQWIMPNHLTLFRMITTPLVWYFFLVDQFLWALVWFIFLAVTDALDGTMARARGQITEWGKFYDPLADKILIASTVIVVMLKGVNIFLSLIIIGIELIFIMGGVLRRRHGLPVQANIWGKIKMNLQVVGVGLVLFGLWLDTPELFQYSTPAFGLAIVFAILSLIAHGI